MTEMETENQTAKRQYLQTTRTRGKPTIVGPNMTEKRKNNYNCVLQLASQPSKSWESKDVVFQKMKPKIDQHIS